MRLVELTGDKLVSQTPYLAKHLAACCSLDSLEFSGGSTAQQLYLNEAMLDTSCKQDQPEEPAHRSLLSNGAII